MHCVHALVSIVYDTACVHAHVDDPACKVCMHALDNEQRLRCKQACLHSVISMPYLTRMQILGGDQ